MGKIKDVKHNTVYYVNWHGTHYLVLYDENIKYKDHFIRFNDKTYNSTGAFSDHNDFLYYISNGNKGITIREATSIEDRWLRKCIEEGKYIPCPKEEIINEYQIY